MATNANLPAGAFITSLGGKRCTAIPKANNVGGGGGTTSTATSTSTSTSTSSSSSSSSSSTSTTSTSTSSTASTSTSTTPTAIIALPSTSTTVQATTTQAAAPAIPPAVAPVLTDTTTTAAAVTTTAAPPPPPPPLQQQTLISTTGSTSVAEIVSSASAVETSAAIAPTSEVGTSIIADLTSATAGNAALLTTIGTGTQATPGQAEATDSSSEPTATSAVSDDSGISTKTTIAVVGGVVGGVVAIALIAFLIWFWQKRIRQKRRSTLLTPLGPESGFGSAREKIPYSNSRDSIGPTTVSEKLKALVGSNVRKIRGRFGGHSPSGSVNLNRGNSQYMEGMTHSRDNSADMGGSAKDRLLGFFGRSDDKPGRGGLKDGPSTGRGMKGAKARPGSQPDFLTLLSMDDKQLSAQTNNGRTSMSNPRRSQSAGSNDHFLGSLNLNFDAANPFSDANIMDRESAKPRPLVITNPDNPFSDANAVQQPVAAKQTGPTTYVQNIRRSRGTSVGGAMTRPPSTDAPSVWRESGTSVASFATRRNKFRSDPFDLDRPELLSSSVGAQVPLPATRNSRTGSLRGSGVPLPPNPAHTRAESLSSSKYSSGVVSLDQWSDPGPDVGPASSRYESPTPTGERKGDGRRRSGASQGSQGSVGKAY